MGNEREERRIVWWFLFLRPGILDPIGLIPRRPRAWPPEIWPKGIARLAWQNRNNFVMKIPMEGGESRAARFDLAALLPFVLLGVAESALILAMGPWAVLWVVASLSVTSFLVGGLAAWTATRHLRKLEEKGKLAELRALPIGSHVLETGLLIQPCAMACAGTVVVNCFFVPTILAAVALKMGMAAMLVAALPLFWSLVRVVVMHSAMRYGVYTGWRAGIEAIRSDDAVPSGLGAWIDLHWKVALSCGLVIAVAGWILFTDLGKELGGFGVMPAFVLLAAFPISCNHWLSSAGRADDAVDQMAAGNLIAAVPDQPAPTP